MKLCNACEFLISQQNLEKKHLLLGAGSLDKIPQVLGLFTRMGPVTSPSRGNILTTMILPDRIR